MQKEIEKKYLNIYEKQSDAIFRHCYFRVSNRELALDIMQETFTKTWKYLADGGEIKNIKAFLYKVANNMIIDHYRKKKATSLENITEQGVQFAIAGGEKSIKRHVDKELALQYMENLDDAYRQVLLMRYVDDMKVKDIAKILNETENAISVRIHRGIKKIKENINN
ncbi:MAG: sigma-70 family RNA polymerase sigma factor [Candidatus Spechtbacterales bacterium]|nr:sigma-70 family RNA polymerase sigma factor [Candidatus Spechtbacterales bacterium]